MKDLISVIVPVFNVEKYLTICLDSLVTQTYKNIEVIMIDDGSTDNSGIICDNYVNRYNNFKVIHKKNDGLGVARNVGLNYLNGGYVTFVDSDDYVEDNYIEILYSFVNKYNVDICKCGFRRVLNNGKVITNCKYNNEYYKDDDVRLKLLPKLIGSSPSLHDSIGMSVWGTMYKSKIIINNHIVFPSEKELISEDLVFNMKYMQYARGGYITEKMLYNYRVNNNSLSISYRKDRFEACKKLYIYIRNMLNSLNYGKEVVLRLDKLFFIQVRMCIAQIKRKPQKTYSTIIEEIYSICNDEMLRGLIDMYPIKLLGIRQKLFLKMIKYKMVNMIFLFLMLERL